MPGQSVIVWDIETVPDLAGFAAAGDDLKHFGAVGYAGATASIKLTFHLDHSVGCSTMRAPCSVATTSCTLIIEATFDMPPARYSALSHPFRSERKI